MDWVTFIAERRIQEAVDRGELDNLKNKGKPLRELGDANLPLEQRVYLTVMRNAGAVPREVELMREAAALRDKAAAAPPEARAALLADLAVIETELDMKLGRATVGRGERARRNAKAPNLVRGAMIVATGRGSGS